ncbi:unnamed protein product [Lathyrus oleraceus]
MNTSWCSSSESQQIRANQFPISTKRNKTHNKTNNITNSNQNSQSFLQIYNNPDITQTIMNKQRIIKSYIQSATTWSCNALERLNKRVNDVAGALRLRRDSDKFYLKA